MAYDIVGPGERPLDPELTSKLFPRPVLRPAPLAEPDGHWEGRIKGETGSARKADFTVKAVLSFAGGKVSGQGASPEFPYNEETCRTFTVRGSQAEHRVCLEIRFDGGYFNDKPFFMTGRMGEDRKTITGSWVFTCGSSCTCSGSTGWFDLVRVETESD